MRDGPYGKIVTGRSTRASVRSPSRSSAHCARRPIGRGIDLELEVDDEHLAGREGVVLEPDAAVFGSRPGRLRLDRVEMDAVEPVRGEDERRLLEGTLRDHLEAALEEEAAAKVVGGGDREGGPAARRAGPPTATGRRRLRARGRRRSSGRRRGAT